MSAGLSPFFSEGLFRELCEHVPSFIWVRDADSGKVLYVNKSWEQLTGHRVEAGAHYRDFFKSTHPDDVDRAERASSASPAGGFDELLRLMNIDGSVRWVRIRTFPICDASGRVCRVLGVGEDFTEIQNTRQSLFASEQKFRALVERSSDLIAVIGADEAFGYLSPAFESILGFPIRDWLGEPFTELIWPEDVTRAQTLLAESIAQPGRVIHWELRVRHHSGALRWMEGTFLNHSSNNAVGGIVVNSRDVSERRRRDETLTNALKAIETALNGVAFADPSGRLTYVNPAFARLWGYSSEAEVLGKTPEELGRPEESQRIIQHVVEHGTWQGEITAVRKDGSTFPALLSASTVRDERGAIVNMMASFLDLTEIKRLEQQFLQAQKMEAVGRLAGGVAHDFNNLLTVITGNASLAMLDLRKADPLWQTFESIQKAAESAASLTRQLLAFSRKQLIEPKVINLNAVVERARHLLVRLIGEDLGLQTSLSPNLWAVRVDPGQMEQILINLAVNARDAMPDGGSLTIETANVELAETYTLRYPYASPGNYVVLSVSDNGSGMTDEVREHLFEPFFTTKEPTKGTGLGLAMVYGAVKQNAGHIEVNSAAGQGTTFKIYLPRVNAVPELKAAGSSDGPDRGTETILLVEDDDGVRSLAKHVLARLGYTVLASSNAMEAFEAFDRATTPVRLLITDVVLPEMNGQVLAQRLRATHPNLKVLFTSGYTTDVIVRHEVLQGGAEFLPKPFSVTDLARRVREVLNKPGAA